MILLRALSIGDAGRIAELLNNKNIWDQLRDFIPFPYSIDDGKDYIGFVESDTSQHIYGIEYNSNLVGVVGLISQSDIYRNSAELGYWLGQDYWKKGIMTQAVKDVVNIGFCELNLLRIYSGVKENNFGSQRVLEKAGFTLEGVFKKAIVKNDIIMDEYRYAILNPDYSVN